MSVWARPRDARKGESPRAKHYTYLVRWRYAGAADGKAYAVTIGHKKGHKGDAEWLDARIDERGKKVTRDEALDMLAEHRHGSTSTSTSTTDDDDEPAPTVGALMAEWLARPGKAKSTKAAYHAVLVNLGDLAAVPADQLTRRQVTRWFVGLEARGYSQSHMLKHKVCLMGSLKRHIKDLGVLAELYADVPRYDGTRRKRPRTKTLGREHVAALLAKAHGTDMWLPLYAMAELGLRYAEMAGLRARDVDLDERVVNVSVQLTQGIRRGQPFQPTQLKTDGSARELPMSNALTDALALVRDLAPDAPVFTPAYGEYWLYDAFRRALIRLVAETPELASLGNAHSHDMRHHAAMRWLRGGEGLAPVPLPLVSEKLLGHARVETTVKMYTQWSGRDLALVREHGLVVGEPG